MEAHSKQARERDYADITRAAEVTEEVDKTIREIFEYREWDEEQKNAGQAVRYALSAAVKTIIARVPPCPTRSVAIRKLIEARMDCNAAITHRGRF